MKKGTEDKRFFLCPAPPPGHTGLGRRAVA